MKKLTYLTPEEIWHLTALEITPAELKFIDNEIKKAEQTAGRKLNRQNKQTLIKQAREKIAAARYVEKKHIARKAKDFT